MNSPKQKHSFQLTVLAQAIRDIIRNSEKYSKPISEYYSDEDE